jgi:hypothetical protein
LTQQNLGSHFCQFYVLNNQQALFANLGVWILKLMTRTPELSGNPTSTYIWKRVGGMDEEMRISRINI